MQSVVPQVQTNQKFFLIPLSKRENFLRETIHNDSGAKDVYLSFKHRTTINYDSSDEMKVTDQYLLRYSFVQLFFMM